MSGEGPYYMQRKAPNSLLPSTHTMCSCPRADPVSSTLGPEHALGIIKKYILRKGV